MKINFDAFPNGIEFPSIAVIPFAKGQVTRDQITNAWHLFKNGTNVLHSIDSYNEIVALWPDNSVKCVHVHGFYGDGQNYFFENLPANTFSPDPIPADALLDWVLQVEDADGVIWKNTAYHRTRLKTIPHAAYKLSLIDKTGMWKYVEPDGTEHQNTKFVEVDDDFIRVTRYEGWLTSGGVHSDGQQSIYRYCTRITRYAKVDAPIKISHAIIFSGPMRNKRIRHISFHVNGASSSQVIYGADSLTPRAINTLPLETVTIHQRRPSKCEVTTPLGVSISRKSDGYVKQGNTTVLVRNFWQKFPQALVAGPDGLTYRQWYGKGLEFSKTERLLDENLHQMLHFHHNECLDNNIPKSNDPENPEWADRYYSFIKRTTSADGTVVLHDNEEGGLAEDFSEYTDYADMQGISIHDDIVVWPGTINLKACAEIWNCNPVGYCDATLIENSGIMDAGARLSDFETIEQFLEDAALSYTDPERFQDYGRFIYGESHRNMLVKFDCPSRHRQGLSLYYCAGETSWRMRMRGGSNAMLNLARISTERYRSIAQVSFDELLKPGDELHPKTQWHTPGGFWYRGCWWGNTYPSTDPGEVVPQEQAIGHGGWNTLAGRIPDPDALLWSWILDGNRYHKDGYELWFTGAKGKIKSAQRDHHGQNTTDSPREGNKTLVYGITAFRHFANHPEEGFRLQFPEKDLMQTNLNELGIDLLGAPWTDDMDGRLWQPEWIRRYVEFIMNDYDGPFREAFASMALTFCIDNYNPNFQQDQRTLDMATLLIDVFQGHYPFFPTPSNLWVTISLADHLTWISRILEKTYKGDPHWFNFGLGDGELGDSLLKLQWGPFVKRLRQVTFNQAELSEYNYHGHYPSASLSGGVHHPSSPYYAMGNKYLVAKPSSGSLDLRFKFAPKLMNSSSGFSFSEIWIVSPQKHLENQNALPSQIKSNKFIGVKRLSGNDNSILLAPSYPSASGVVNLETLRTQGAFSSYSLYNLTHTRFNWEQSDPFITNTGVEDNTFTDVAETIESGIFRIYINGKSVYPGLTQNGLHEAMLLTPYAEHPDRDDSGDYLFTDSVFYLKNIENSPVEISFWASVLTSANDGDARGSFGSFARVKIKDPNPPYHLINSHELKYEGEGYGTESIRETHTIAPEGIIILKTTLIYLQSIVRMRISGRLLCGRTMEDIQAIDDVLVNEPRWE